MLYVQAVQFALKCHKVAADLVATLNTAHPHL